MNRQELINEMPEGKHKIVEQRLLDLDNELEVGDNEVNLMLKLVKMYEIYKDVYGDEIKDFAEVMQGLPK